MYGKIFESMYDGTLSADWKAMVTFQQLIVLSDSQGVVDYTPPALSRRTGIPLEIIEHGIAKLEEPDPYSRNPDCDGRRIVRLDDHRPWGWQIVNHGLYRDMASLDDQRVQARERKRRQREKDAQVTDKKDSSRTVTDCHATSRMSRHADADTNTLKIGQFDQFWDAYPKHVKKKTAHEIWRRKKLDQKADRLLADVIRRKSEDRRWRDGFIPDPPTYLNQERWNDEIEAPKVSSGLEFQP